MNCEEALVEMETMSTSDIQGSAVAMHTAGCRECARVLQAISDADRLMMQERDESYFTTTPEAITQRAVMLGQRRRVFGGMTVLALVLVAFSVWFSIMMIEQADERQNQLASLRPSGNYETESFEIRCLSTTNVKQLIGPYTDGSGADVHVTQPPLRVFTVRASRESMEKIRDVLQRFDTPAHGDCRLPDVPKAPSADVAPPADPPPSLNKK